MAAGVHGTEVKTVISTADATLSASGGFVHWITISNTHATESAKVELDNGGTDVWGVVVEAVDFLLLPFHASFDPPIHFDTSIILDITDGTVQVTVGLT